MVEIVSRCVIESCGGSCVRRELKLAILFRSTLETATSELFIYSDLSTPSTTHFTIVSIPLPNLNMAFI